MKRMLHIVLGLLVVGGCHGDDGGPTCLDTDPEKHPHPDFPLQRQTAHLDIYSEGFVCAGSGVDFERQVGFVSEQLGVELRTNIPVYLSEERPELCPPNSGGCLRPGGVVLSMPPAVYHELNHAVACQLRTGTSAMFTEGLAVMFDPNGATHIFEADDHLSDLLKNWDRRYANVGHFARWLLEREGVDTFVAFYRDAHGSKGATASLEELYGASLEDLEAEYLASAPIKWVPFRQCADLPHVERDDEGVWRYSAFMDCEDESTMGPYVRGLDSSAAGVQVEAWDLMYQSFTFTLEEEHHLGYEFQGAIVRVDFERCGDAHPHVDEDDRRDHGSLGPKEPNGYAIPNLEAGTWRADVLLRHGPPSPVGVSFWEYF